MERILVTIMAGFIGSHLCEALLKKGNDVIGVDNLSNGKLKNIKTFKNKNFKFFKCDINNAKVINEILNEIDIIYHLAALADIVPSIQKSRIIF